MCVACLCKYAYVSEGVCLHLLLGACTNLLGIQTALPSHHTTCISRCGMCGPLPPALCPRSHWPLCTPLPPTVYTATSWYPAVECVALCPLPSALGATGHCALLSLLLCALQQAGTYYLFSTSCAGNLIKEIAHPLCSLCGRDTAFCTCTCPQAMSSSCMHAYLPTVTYSYANECIRAYVAAYVHMAMLISLTFKMVHTQHLHTTSYPMA